MRTTTTRERLARALERLRTMRVPRPAPTASAPCSGPCGCDLIGDVEVTR